MCTHDGLSDASRSSCCASKNFSWAYVDRLFEKLPDWQELWLIDSWPSTVLARVPSLCHGKHARCSRLTLHLSTVKYSSICPSASITSCIVQKNYSSIDRYFASEWISLIHGNYVWRHETRLFFHISNPWLFNYYLCIYFVSFILHNITVKSIKKTVSTTFTKFLHMYVFL